MDEQLTALPDPERGASAVEYALLAAFIAAVIVGAVLVFGQTVGHKYHDSCTSISTQFGEGTCS